MKKLRQCKRMIAAIMIAIIGLLSAGCWDMRELQNRNFVMAVGIDLAEQAGAAKQDKAQVENFTQAVGDRRYRLSLQIYKPAERRGSQRGGAGETFIISNTGQSMFEMVRDMSGQSSKSLYFEHIQAIVVSEAVVRQYGLRSVLDFFLRDPEMRTRVRVFITPGKAEDILEFKPPTGEPGGVFLSNIADNYPINVHLVGRVADIGEIIETLVNKGDPMLPRVEVADKVLKVGGVALFKQDRFVTFVDEYITKGNRFIIANEKQAPVTLPCPEHPDELIVFVLKQQNTKLIPRINGDSLYFTLDIAMQGEVREMGAYKARHDLQKSDYLEKLEPLFAAEFKNNIDDSYNLCQRYGIDAYKLGLHIKAYQPKTWKKIKDRWDEIYPTVPLVVSVNVTITDTGEHQ